MKGDLSQVQQLLTEVMEQRDEALRQVEGSEMESLQTTAENTQPLKLQAMADQNSTLEQQV